jgi:hypothetical protein
LEEGQYICDGVPGQKDLWAGVVDCGMLGRDTSRGMWKLVEDKCYLRVYLFKFTAAPVQPLCDGHILALVGKR